MSQFILPEPRERTGLSKASLGLEDAAASLGSTESWCLFDSFVKHPLSMGLGNWAKKGRGGQFWGGWRGRGEIGQAPHKGKH